METSNTYSIIMDLFLIAIFAVVLFMLLRISFIFLNYLLTGSKIRQKILRIFYFLQFSIWFAFIVLALNSTDLKTIGL